MFTSTEEFLDGLREMQRATGTSFRVIASRSEGHLPRTTAHNMVKPQRTMLPMRPEQVAWFVTGCGGSSLDAKFWLEQWRQLREHAERRRPQTTATAASSAVPEQLPELPAPFEKLIDLQLQKRTTARIIRRKVKRVIERQYAFSLKSLLVTVLFATLIVTATLFVPPLFAR